MVREEGDRAGLSRRYTNLGYGASEVGDDSQGSFKCLKTIDVSISGHQYGLTAGIKPLRAPIANLYNVHHHQSKNT